MGYIVSFLIGTFWGTSIVAYLTALIEGWAVTPPV